MISEYTYKNDEFCTHMEFVDFLQKYKTPIKDVRNIDGIKIPDYIIEKNKRYEYMCTVLVGNCNYNCYMFLREKW